MIIEKIETGHPIITQNGQISILDTKFQNIG